MVKQTTPKILVDVALRKGRKGVQSSKIGMSKSK
jgi:hypothetical protein